MQGHENVVLLRIAELEGEPGFRPGQTRSRAPALSMSLPFMVITTLGMKSVHFTKLDTCLTVDSKCKMLDPRCLGPAHLSSLNLSDR